jgi:hypothetical protein
MGNFGEMEEKLGRMQRLWWEGKIWVEYAGWSGEDL